MHFSSLIRWIRSGSTAPVILAVLLVVICLTGGASRADVLGQGVVRAAALFAVAGWILTGASFNLRRVRIPLAIIVGSMLLIVIQLVPLPAGIWSSLPGRGTFAAVVAAAGLDDVSRPIALVPDRALNALLSLLVPLAVLLGAATLPADHERRLIAWLLAAVGVSALVALFQLSSGGIDNPFVNDVLGQPSGLFANRNHQALFLDFGILLALAWGFDPSRRVGFRSVTALGLVGLLALLVVATGSRAGLGLLALALLLGATLAWTAIRRATRGSPRWVRPAVILLPVVAASVLAALSIGAGRAAAFDRLLAIDTASDIRSRAVPTLRALINQFFPVGSGLGSFEPMFRMAEPFELLKLTYFNHAHNDFVEVLIEAGLPGALLLLYAVVWWLVASWRAWRAEASTSLCARLGSSIILLIFLASAVDYPARTPLIMASLAIAACWLALPTGHGRRPV